MGLLTPKRIYLDYAAATPTLFEVYREMAPYLVRDFYNPNAIYKEGREVRREIENARERVAKILSATKSQIFFTSSGTESDYLAIMGVFEAFKVPAGKKPHIIISSVEHPAVVDAAFEVERRGGKVSVVEVDQFGRVDADKVRTLIKPNTFLVSVMLANNELGTLEPVAKIGRLVREYRKENESEYPYLHTDASQAPSYERVDLESLNADLITLDGAKIYGPKSIGVLATRRGVNLRHNLLEGGTENPAVIKGFARALSLAVETREKESARLRNLQQFFITQVKKRLPQAIVNTPSEGSLPSIVSISIPGVLSELILLALDKEGVTVSTGSACTNTGNLEGSPVIHAIGKSELAESTIRFSFGRATNKRDLEKALNLFVAIVERGKIKP